MEQIYGSDFLFATALTQMSATRGIKKFDKKATDALASEWKQLDLLAVFKGREYHSLIKDKQKMPYEMYN